MKLNIDRMAKDSSGVLGPGKRVMIWLHGCNRNCPGCIVQKHNATPEPQFSLSNNAVLDYINADDQIEGITVSGGEPLLQMDALIALLKCVRELNLGVILYSGYTLAEIKSMEQGNTLIENLDVLIDGPYIQELDDNGAHRGSSNQQIHLLTSRYESFYKNEKSVRESVIVQNGSLLRLTGIPDKKTKALWKGLKEEE